MTIKREIKDSWRPATRLVHGGQLRSQYKETAETIYMTSGYVYESAEEAEAAFDNSQPRFVYSRFGNPTVSMFEERLALLEGAVAALAHEAGACVIVDNVFATPLLQQPLKQGADVVVYSATKHIDGQGRCLGGAVLSNRKFVEETLQPFLRHTGPSLSPMNAWI